METPQKRVTRLVGDIHGDYQPFRSLVSDCEESIQIGDYGWGFNPPQDEHQQSWLAKHPQHKHIRGNHDNPEVANASPNYLGDFAYFPEKSLLVVGGAWSIDYYHRREGRSYWHNEELSQDQFDHVEDLFVKEQPQVVISHDAPYKVPIKLGLLDPAFGGSVLTRTGYRLQKMLYMHSPKFWFFGHWHKSTGLQKIGDTSFCCIGINDHVDFSFDRMEVV